MTFNMKRILIVKLLTLLLGFVIVWMLFMCVTMQQRNGKAVTRCKEQETKDHGKRAVTNIRTNMSAISDRIGNILQPYQEKLFLYKETLLRKHVLSSSTMAVFRNDIENSLGKNISKLLFLTQRNSPEGTKLKHYLGRKKTTLKVSADFHRLLPKDSTLHSSRSCSVVGNSGNLLRSKCGKRIDSADFVYRCNIAPLKPFAEDAGMKSNLTSFNPSILIKRYNLLKEPNNIEQFLHDMREYNGYLWGACLSSSSYVPLCTKALQNYNNTGSNLVLGNPHHYQKNANFWKKLGLSKRPSTGFYFVTDAITRCSEINVYGFWPFPHLIDSALRNVSYHYFDDLKFPGTDGKDIAHSMNEEFSILLQLHILGIVKLNIGVC